MTTAKKIQRIVSDFPDDFVFVTSDIDCDVRQREAVARALQRMAERGEISKLSNGKYFKPRMTVFGALKPSPSQIAKEYLVKDGKTIGYLTGGTAFSRYSLTTQISSEIQIGTNQYRRPLKRGNHSISFVLQPNSISESDVDLLRLLDCFRFIKDIPGTTPGQACGRLMRIVNDLSEDKQVMLLQYALKYTPHVRALLGAVMEYGGSPECMTKPLRQSLNGISKYRLPISETILPNKKNWRIYEPTR
ncbi:MAG: hypothetical protein K2I92_06575 [Muribaculaceae bacterium]|nr:hypothetical protein [Muribaculaceae bacterium]